MLNEIPNVIVILVVLITTNATTIMIFNYQMTSASLDDNDDDKSILPNYREGYEILLIPSSRNDRFPFSSDMDALIKA